MSTVDCDLEDPPLAPGHDRGVLGGSSDWDGETRSYEHVIKYSCGDYAKFDPGNNTASVEEDSLSCLWNRTWSKNELMQCKGTIITRND